jgi:hypothetical protein
VLWKGCFLIWEPGRDVRLGEVESDAVGSPGWDMRGT